MRVAKNVNVVKFYDATCDQLAITNWLCKQAKLSKSAPVYFDDADLVWVDRTIVSCALVDSKLTMQDLLDAVVQASAQK